MEQVLSISKDEGTNWAYEEIANEFASNGDNLVTAFTVEMHFANVLEGLSFVFHPLLLLS